MKDASIPIIYIQDLKETDNLTDIVSVQDLIVLEESEEGMLIHPDKAFLLPDRSFIFKDRGNRILKYSFDGSFSRTIGQRGRGPQEYNLCRDIALSQDGRELNVMDLGNIITYDAGDGHFIRRIEIPHHNYDEFCFGPNGGFYLFAASPDLENYSTILKHDLLTLISSDGALCNQLLPRQDYILNVALLSRSSRGTTYLRPLEGENILYEITESCIRPLLKVDFGSLQSPTGFLTNNGSLDMERYIMSRYYKMALYFHDTQQSLYFGCMGPNGVGFHNVVDPVELNGYTWKDSETDPSPTLILTSDTKALYAMVFNLESKMKMDEAILNPLDRVIMREVKKRQTPINGNPLLAKISFPLHK